MTSQPSNPLLEARAKLEEAEGLRRAGQLDLAQASCEALVTRYSDYVGALHTLGLVHADKGDNSRALTCLVRAVMLNPMDWRTLTALAGVYLQLGAREMAAQTLEQARMLKPEDAAVAHTLGEIYRQEREYELAAEAFRRAYAQDRGLKAAAMGLGWSCVHLGRLDEAAAVFGELVESGSRTIKTLYALSELPAPLVKLDLLSLLDGVVADEKEDRQEFESLAAATRAAALDREGRYAQAWENVVVANRYPFQKSREAQARAVRWREASEAQLRGASIEAGAGGASRDGNPLSLFILGPSRSGKTTMEQLAASLDGVKRGYENPMVESAVRRAFQTEGLLTSSRFALLPLNLDGLWRDLYLSDLNKRAGAAKVFTNTHPEIIHDAARIAAALPGARFVLMKRDADDLSLRIYMKQYEATNPYAYALGDIRDYVAWYNRMIDGLTEKLPARCRVVRYEDMVADPGAAARTVAELCGLAAPTGPLPAPGDDRGCAAPYREFMRG
jgi:Flp pilus assembly protein TadD